MTYLFITLPTTIQVSSISLGFLTVQYLYTYLTHTCKMLPGYSSRCRIIWLKDHCYYVLPNLPPRAFTGLIDFSLAASPLLYERKFNFKT